MSGHHRSEQRSHGSVRNFIVGSDIGQRSVVNRKLDVGISGRIPVSGKMLAAASHTCLRHAAHHRCGQYADNARIAMESSITDNCALTIIQIQTGSKSKVDAAGS